MNFDLAPLSNLTTDRSGDHRRSAFT